MKEGGRRVQERDVVGEAAMQYDRAQEAVADFEDGRGLLAKDCGQPLQSGNESFSRASSTRPHCAIQTSRMVR